MKLSPELELKIAVLNHFEDMKRLFPNDNFELEKMTIAGNIACVRYHTDKVSAVGCYRPISGFNDIVELIPGTLVTCPR